MKLTRCKNGHFYDSEKFALCPNCAHGDGTIEFSKEHSDQIRRNLEQARAERSRIAKGGLPKNTFSIPIFLGEKDIDGNNAKQKKGAADIRRCANGHIFDAKKHKTCPRCADMDTEPEQKQNETEPAETEKLTQEDPREATTQQARSPMITCSKGHWYNSDVFDHCPACKVGGDMIYSEDMHLFKYVRVTESFEDKSGEQRDEAREPETETNEERRSRLGLVMCPDGHWYDGTQNVFCPVCEELGLDFDLNKLKKCPNGHIYKPFDLGLCPICHEEGVFLQGIKRPAVITERINPFADPEHLHRLELEEPWLRICPKGHQFNSKLYGDCPVCDVNLCEMENQWSDYYADRTPDRVWYTPLDQEIEWDMPAWAGASLCKVERDLTGLFCDPLSRSLNVIGRGVGNHIRAEGNGVKFKEHACILCDRENDTYYFIAGNTDGEKNQFSQVNGKRINAGGIVRLQEGDLIWIGISVWCFVKSVNDFERALSIVKKVSDKFYSDETDQ